VSPRGVCLLLLLPSLHALPHLILPVMFFLLGFGDGGRGGDGDDDGDCYSHDFSIRLL
jgi:hypothetical protein